MRLWKGTHSHNHRQHFGSQPHGYRNGEEERFLLSASMRGRDYLAIGNAIGSNMFSVLIILGLTEPSLVVGGQRGLPKDRPGESKAENDWQNDEIHQCCGGQAKQDHEPQRILDFLSWDFSS